MCGWPRPVFLSLSTTDIRARYFLLWDCNAHCGVFTSICDLCPLDTGNLSPLLVMTVKNIATCFMQSKITSGLKNQWIRCPFSKLLFCLVTQLTLH